MEPDCLSPGDSTGSRRELQRLISAGSQGYMSILDWPGR